MVAVAQTGGKTVHDDTRPTPDAGYFPAPAMGADRFIGPPEPRSAGKQVKQGESSQKQAYGRVSELIKGDEALLGVMAKCGHSRSKTPVP